MKKIIVVGAGVSGAHAALTLLERKFDVELWDVGREESPFPEAETTFHQLKKTLDDPTAYFLGKDLSALIPPATDELLRYPPSRHFLTSQDDSLWGFNSESFFPYGSLNKGGLANGWGANALSFDDDDLGDWPISSTEMQAAYKSVYKRIAVAGPDKDDLSPFLSGAYPSQSAIQMSRVDQRILQTYKKNSKTFNKMGVRIGQARLAVVTDPLRDDACDYCERCLWGCPRQSIYNPVSTLEECAKYAGFNYISGRYVLSLLSSERRICGIRYLDTKTQEIHESTCDTVFLSAGALQTGGVFLRTLKSAYPELSTETEGLMDTQVIKLPYVALRNIGQAVEERSFQFNRLIMGIVNASPAHDSWPRYLHGEMLQLTSLIYHPLIESLPFDAKLSKQLFFTLKSALGTVSLFFPDKITSNNKQLLVDEGGRWDKIQLQYTETAESKRYVEQSVATVRKALWRLACIPQGIIQSPFGSGIHYAGTVPMGNGPKKCDKNGQANLFSNLYIADGAAFPSLPSKSITLSLAAHATRVAQNAKL